MAMAELIDQQSPVQHIRLFRCPELGLTMTLDEDVQFTERDEARYHECLGVVPMLFCQARTAFIGGGGDGLVAARLLRFPSLERAVLCDYDPAVTDLARAQPDLVALNAGSLSDDRLAVVNEDAAAFLERTNERFDLVICDFPNPVTEELARLYSDWFYALVSKRVHDHGVVCVQMPMLDRTCALVRRTLQTVFAEVRIYRNTYRHGGGTAFALASREPLERKRSVPEWTRYLNDPVADALFAIPRDESFDTDEINTVDNGRIARVTLLDTHLDALSRQHRYNPAYRVVVVDDQCPCPRHLVGPFIRYCDELYPLLLYVACEELATYQALLAELGYAPGGRYCSMRHGFTPSNLSCIDRWWHRLNNGSVKSIDAYFCRTDERPELVQLMTDYLSRYADRYLDIPENPGVMNTERLHLVARTPAGQPAGFMVLLPEEQMTVDVFLGLGGPRVNMLSVLLCLRFLEREYGCRLAFQAATQNIVSLMTKLGAEVGRWYQAFAKGPSPGERGQI